MSNGCLHHWPAVGTDCPQCGPRTAAGPQWSGLAYTETADGPEPRVEGYPECLERPARAIAASKRGKKPSDPEIDNIWLTYVGQAKACIVAFLEQSAEYRKSLDAPQPRYVPRGRGLVTPPAQSEKDRP